MGALACRVVRRSLAVLLLAGVPLAAGSLPFPEAWARQSQPFAAQESGPEVRVLLVEAPQLELRAPQGAQLRDGAGRGLPRLPAGSLWRLRVTAAGLTLGVAPAAAAEEVVAAPIVRGLRELWIEPPSAGPEAALAVGGRAYRGRLRVFADGERLRLVNHVGLEAYLASVVGSEMPASWPQQALRAQAVAARTYALRQRRPTESFDLQATTASQVYRGLEAETSSTREAVAATRAMVLTYRGELINAVFHSSSGGSTANSGEVWSRQLPYLVSVPDFDDQSPVRQWQQPLTAEQLRRTFAEIGGVERIEVLSSTADGRIRQARLIGPIGQLQLSGAELRSRLGLRSTWVRFEPQPRALPDPTAGSPLAALALAGRAQGLGLPSLPPLLLGNAPAAPLAEPSAAGLTPLPGTDWLAIGRGFGHGVGMSQWGAYGLARRGEGFEQILRHFYRGADLRPHGLASGPEVAGLP